MLQLCYDTNTQYEISLDEAGRGCLFGRVYVGCVVLPKDGSFCGKDIKDSKKFSSKKKLNAVADYIKENALVWHVAYVEPKVIDETNILKAVMHGMHECIRSVVSKLELIEHDTQLYQIKYRAIVDGNYFTPYRSFDETSDTIVEMPHVTVEKGDGTYMAIAAASILAKSARDQYILELCSQKTDLVDHYGFDTNMGYGTKKHLDGLKQYGPVEGHRMSFAPMKDQMKDM